MSIVNAIMQRVVERTLRADGIAKEPARIISQGMRESIERNESTEVMAESIARELEAWRARQKAK